MHTSRNALLQQAGVLQQKPLAGWLNSRVCMELTLSSSLSNGIDSVRLGWPIDRGAGPPLNARELQAPEKSPHTSGSMQSLAQRLLKRQLSKTPHSRHTCLLQALSHMWQGSSDMQSSALQ